MWLNLCEECISSNQVHVFGSSTCCSLCCNVVDATVVGAQATLSKPIWKKGKSGFNIGFVYTACTQAVYTGSPFTFRGNKRDTNT